KIVPGSERTGWGVPTEGAVSGGASCEELDRGIGEDPDAVVNATVEHHLREYGKICRGREEPCVARDAAECIGVLVVDFSPRSAPSAGGSGRGDACIERVGRPEFRLVHAEGVEDVIGQELVQWLLRDGLRSEE